MIKSMARDIFHDTVRQALEADGWTITDDPYTLSFGGQNLYVDLGAERVIAAERAGDKIAVEVKSFISRSPVNDLENALGQYLLYRSILQRRDPDRLLYLAVTTSVYAGILSSPLGRVALDDYALKLVVFQAEEARVQQWIN